MKYEMIFGDEKLFDGAPEDAEAVFKNQMRETRCAYYRLSHGHERYASGEWVKVPSIDSQTFSAMRRIIKEPKRWTWEDKKVGRLPEVLGKVATYDGKTYLFVGESCHDNQWSLKDDATGKVYYTPTGDILPIETPAEKAQRERDEWIESAYNFSTKGTYPEIDFGYLYDALKSGELPMPNKE